MVLTKSNKGLLKLSNNVINSMNEYVQDKHHKDEAGGVLLGRFILNSKDIIIDKVTIPLQGDFRSRFRYIREADGHQSLINEAWESSDGTCNYLGEWHTHPEDYPNPSGQDLKNWKEILNTRTFSSQYLYFIIVGIEEIRIWEGYKRKLRIKRIR
jgi:integrative and conjugative element protein (TIGR02256 family)